MTRPPTGAHNPIAAILLMVFAALSFTVLDGTAKHLAAEYPVPQIVWGRYVFNLALMALFVPKVGTAGLWRTARPMFQIVRGLMLVGATASIFMAVKFLPLSETYAISFVSPFIVTLAAALILREHVGPRRWLTIAVGFVGVLIVLSPGGGALGWAAVFPFMMACFWAAYQIMTRIIGTTDPPLATLFYTALTGTVASTVAVLFVWQPISFDGWIGLAFIGAVGLAGQLALIRAYALAEASLLSPLVYTQIVWAGLIGYFVFGDVPDGATIAGAVLIVVCGILLVRHPRA